nr:hypothetical protein GCM10020093_059780 [Planobispora longispora]
MRSIWNGAVSFGLVTIPIRLYTATEQRNVAFHQVHRDDGGRVRFRRVCEVCGEEIPFAHIAKGYELPTGEMVVLGQDDFEDLPLTTAHRIEVLQFSPADQIDPILFNKSYYMAPDPMGIKPYVLLRDALERSGRVAIAKVALRQRESLATLRVREGCSCWRPCSGRTRSARPGSSSWRRAWRSGRRSRRWPPRSSRA